MREVSDRVWNALSIGGVLLAVGAVIALLITPILLVVKWVFF